nr:uncharacterized protein DDB_G0284459-like [Lytechinus pictus]
MKGQVIGMASSGSAVRYPGFPDSMRRTAPAGHSRIPVPQTQRPDANRHVSAPQRSRLLAMQDAYQKKLMKEKEEKMLAIYNKQQDQALQKVTRHGSKAGTDEGQGIVRDFFRERKQMEQSKHSAEIISRDMHFQKKLQERKNTSGLSNTNDASNIQNRQAKKISDLQEQKLYEERKQQEMLNYKRQQQQNQMQQQQKPAKGTVRSNPLAPIKRDSVKMKVNGPPSSSYEVYETSGNLAYDEDDHPMKPLSKPQKVSHRSKQRIDYEHSSPNNMNTTHDLPPQPAKHLNRKKVAPPISKEKSPMRAKKGKKRDFQKWQEEQDLERQERLKKYEDTHSQPNNDFTVDYDRELKDEMESAKNRRKKEYDDMMAKERELEAMIAKHKHDLARMSMDDDSDDEMDSFPAQKSRQPVKKQTKSQSKATFHYEDEESFTYRNDGDDYESRAGEFKSRQKQVSKPKRKALPRDPDPEPSPPPPAPMSHDTSLYDQAIDDGGEVMDLNLVECSVCGRRFAADRLSKHKSVCKNASKKKRKVFDTTQHRTQGTELAQYVKKGQHLKNDPPAKPSNWKRKHEDFVRSIRDARETQAYVAKGGKLSDLPPPPPSENPDYKQCPYCARKFNQTAAERHIPHCKNTKSRPKPPLKKK